MIEKKYLEGLLPDDGEKFADSYPVPFAVQGMSLHWLQAWSNKWFHVVMYQASLLLVPTDESITDVMAYSLAHPGKKEFCLKPLKNRFEMSPDLRLMVRLLHANSRAGQSCLPHSEWSQRLASLNKKNITVEVTHTAIHPIVRDGEGRGWGFKIIWNPTLRQFTPTALWYADPESSDGSYEQYNSNCHGDVPFETFLELLWLKDAIYEALIP